MVVDGSRSVLPPLGMLYFILFEHLKRYLYILAMQIKFKCCATKTALPAAVTNLHIWRLYSPKGYSEIFWNLRTSAYTNASLIWIKPYSLCNLSLVETRSFLVYLSTVLASFANRIASIYKMIYEDYLGPIYLTSYRLWPNTEPFAAIYWCRCFYYWMICRCFKLRKITRQEYKSIGNYL